ncbi:hypothetical protein CRG92_17230 [Escherichia sp. E2586]|nr:hypothetical protein CRG92_17230 [Escherichia sp. E2586]
MLNKTRYAILNKKNENDHSTKHQATTKNQHKRSNKRKKHKTHTATMRDFFCIKLDIHQKTILTKIKKKQNLIIVQIFTNITSIKHHQTLKKTPKQTNSYNHANYYNTAINILIPPQDPAPGIRKFLPSLANATLLSTQ